MNKKLTPILLCIFCLIGIITTSVSAAPKAMNWYCKHVTNGEQPTCDSQMKCIEDYDGFYIDHNNVDANAEEKVIYLTFDAGYENGNIKKILSVLREEQVPAAFFVLEHLVCSEPELIREMDQDGHFVCNHTANHRDMSKIQSEEKFLAELTQLEQTCLEKTGVSVKKYYRPPEGRFSLENLSFAKNAGYKTVFWSFGYVDWDNEHQMSPSDALEKILGGIHNGEVLLLHPTSNTNALIMKDLICELRARGYRFGTLDELCAPDNDKQAS